MTDTIHKPPTRSVSGIFRTLHYLEDGFLVLFFVSMITISFAQIALRNLFSINLFWAEPLIRHLVLWSGFLGALIATRQDKHIRLDVLLRICSPRCRILLQCFTSLFSATVCLLLTVVAVRFLGDERSFHTGTLLHVSTWQWQLIFPFTFAGMSLRFLGQCTCQAIAFVREKAA